MNVKTAMSPTLEELQLALKTELRESLLVGSIRHLEATAEQIDARLCAFIESSILAHPRILLHRTQYDVVHNAIRQGRSLWRPRVRESATEPGVVEIALVASTNRSRVPFAAATDLALEGHGRFRTARLWMPMSVRVDQERFGLTVCGLFATGYRWLEESVRGLVDRPELSIGRELYSYLRPHLSDRLLTQVWFGSGHRNRGVFLLDPRFGMGVLNLIDRDAKDTGDNPLRLLLAFFGCDIPIEDTFGTIAVTQPTSQNGTYQCMDFSLSQARYRHDLPLLVRAQIAMCGSEGLSVFPIHKDSSGHLITSFPTRLRSQILPVLELHRPDLAGIYKRELCLMRQFLRALDRSDKASWPEVLGKLTGAAGAAFVKDLAKP